jgi:hypothetical protein
MTRRTEASMAKHELDDVIEQLETCVEESLEEVACMRNADAPAEQIAEMEAHANSCGLGSRILRRERDKPGVPTTLDAPWLERFKEGDRVQSMGRPTVWVVAAYTRHGEILAWRVVDGFRLEHAVFDDEDELTHVCALVKGGG